MPARLTISRASYSKNLKALASGQGEGAAAAEPIWSGASGALTCAGAAKRPPRWERGAAGWRRGLRQRVLALLAAELLGDLQVLLEGGDLLGGRPADRAVAAHLDLVLGLGDVLLVVLGLEVGIALVELRAGELGHRLQLPLHGRRGGLGDVDAQRLGQVGRLLQRLAVVLDQARAVVLDRLRRALLLGELAAGDLEAVALDRGLQVLLVEGRVAVAGAVVAAVSGGAGRQRTGAEDRRGGDGGE